MKHNYVNLEVDKIMNDSQLTYPLNMALSCAWIAANFKGEDLKILEVGKVGPLTDYFVLVTATNISQAIAIAGEISAQIKRQGYKIYSKEGIQGQEWILIDGGDIIVHIFQPQARPIYDLDHLWEQAPMVKIPESYYFGTPEIANSTPEVAGYF